MEIDSFYSLGVCFRRIYLRSNHHINDVDALQNNNSFTHVLYFTLVQLCVQVKLYLELGYLVSLAQTAVFQHNMRLTLDGFLLAHYQ